MKNLILILFSAVLFLVGCGSNSAKGTGNEIPYEIANNYFVRNDIESSETTGMLIESQESLEQYFGYAATMTSLPTPIDFARQEAIAVIFPETDMAMEVSVSSLVQKEGKIVLTYTESLGEKQTFTIRPCLMLIISNEYTGELEIVKK